MHAARFRTLPLALLAALALAALALAAPAAAQTEVRPGDQVRVWTEGGARVEGRLERLGLDSLRIVRGHGGAFAIPAEDVERLDVRRPAKGPGLGILLGVPLGALAGGLLGSAMDDSAGCTGAQPCRSPGGLAGALAGAGLGGFVGGLADLALPGKRWVRASNYGAPEVTVAPARGGVAITLSFEW